MKRKTKNIAFIYVSIFIFILPKLSIGQYCTNDIRFTDQAFFEEGEIDSMTLIAYTFADDWQGVSTTLLGDVYYPSLDKESLDQRPYVLLINAGDLITADRTLMRSSCIEFAKRGFISGTLDLRLGWDPNQPTTKLFALYRAQQDIISALKFTVDNAEVINIDTSQIFVGGIGIGADLALNLNYTTQEDWNEIFPGIDFFLGDLNTSGTISDAEFTIKGIYNDAGKISEDLIAEDKILPTISFFGTMDTITEGHLSPEGELGPISLHENLAQNTCSALYVDPSGAQPLATTLDQKTQRIKITKAACFFKSLFCNSCTSSFTEELSLSECNFGTSVSSLNKQEDISLFPNPAVQFINLKINDEYTGALNLNIFDPKGSLLHSKVLNTSTRQHKIDIQHLTAGSYILSIKTQSNQVYTRFIVL